MCTYIERKRGRELFVAERESFIQREREGEKERVSYRERMENPPKPWKAEYAKSARSSCKTCKQTIDKGKFRLGKMVQATQFDGFMPMWNHADCILKESNQIKSFDDVEGIESLRQEDQQKIRKYLEGDGHQNSPASAVMECSVESSQTSRATCKRCSQKIMKGEVRISSKHESQSARSLAWYHANCYTEMSPTAQVEKLSGWDSLSASDQAAVSSLVKKVPSTTKSGTKVELQKDKEPLQQSTSKGGAKRKRAVSSDQQSKFSKTEGEALSEKNVTKLEGEDSKTSNDSG